MNKVVVIDYGLGNLFSVERALRYVGADVDISDEAEKIENADYLILPGVGSFGDGIEGLKKNNLIEPITRFVEKEKPLLGICLGMQLLMTSGEEFGRHEGLNFVPGRVVRLEEGTDGSKTKVPHVGWNSLLSPRSTNGKTHFWDNTIIEDVKPGMFVYFVHSYMVMPDDSQDVLATTEYGENKFCSVLRKDNIFACQFHPERSGEVGLEIYRQFLSLSVGDYPESEV